MSVNSGDICLLLGDIALLFQMRQLYKEANNHVYLILDHKRGFLRL